MIYALLLKEFRWMVFANASPIHPLNAGARAAEPDHRQMGLPEPFSHSFNGTPTGSLFYHGHRRSKLGITQQDDIRILYDHSSWLICAH